MKSSFALLHPFTCVAVLALASITSSAQTQASCSFTLFTLPNTIASGDFALGINSFSTVVGQLENVDQTTDGFIRYSGGHLNFFAPNARTALTARNDVGNSVGTEYTPPKPVSFMLHGSSGVTSIIHPKAVQGTFVTGINKFNRVVGYYLDANNVAHGFKYFSNGSFMTLNFPSPNIQTTVPVAINDSGTIVGYYTDLYGSHGFIYSGGKWASVEYPNAAIGSTILNGISDSNTIIGFHNNSGLGVSFLYKNGTFKVISYSKAAGGTYSTGMAANGLITGNLYLASNNGSPRQFIATCK